jgi:uncharacterized protein YaeQ
MALKATIFKTSVQISDMDRNYYQAHHLTVARHPSETDERMMLRILAFCLNASDSLEFTRGISSDDEPDLWEKNLIDEIELWIELGQPDEKRIRKACNRAKRAIIYCYGGQSTSAWWQHIQHKLERLQNLSVIHIPAETSKALAQLVQRGMQLQCMIQDGETWIGDEQTRILVKPETWL